MGKLLIVTSALCAWGVLPIWNKNSLEIGRRPMVGRNCCNSTVLRLIL